MFDSPLPMGEPETPSAYPPVDAPARCARGVGSAVSGGNPDADQ